MLRELRYILEGSLVLFAMLLFRLLPLDFASMLAGKVARVGGPFSRAHKTASINLERSMPELNPIQRQQILGEMWDNIGRVIGEYPHLARPVMKRRITIEGREHLEKVAHSGQAAIIISGHFANWEIA